MESKQTFRVAPFREFELLRHYKIFVPSAALVAAPVRPEADPLLLPAEPRPSWKAFDPHFLNMTDLIDFPGPFNFEVSVLLQESVFR